jgi:tetratricopeptide (TPR) repeat protein
MLSWCQDRDADSLRHYRAAQAIYERLGMREELGLIEGLLGFTQRNDGHPAEARVHFERARTMGEELRSNKILARALSGLGSLAIDNRDFERARQLKEQSLGFFRELGDQWIVALITGGIGRMYLAAGDVPAGRRLLTEALMLARSLGGRAAIPYGLEAMADICAREGNARKAVRLYGAASVLREALALAYSTIERISYDKALNLLHKLVPDDVFDLEWKRGGALTLAGAIDEALGE